MSFYKEYLKNQQGQKEELLAVIEGKDKPQETRDFPKEEIPDRVDERREPIKSPPKKEFEKRIPKDKKPSDPNEPTKGYNAQEKLAEIQEKEDLERQRFLKRVQGEDIPEPSKTKELLKEPVSTMSVPQRPSQSQKTLTRLIVILSLLVIIGMLSFVWYWLLTREPAPVVIPEVPIIIDEEENVPEPIIAPRSILRYDLFREPTATKSNEIETYLKQYLNEEIESGKMIKISIRDEINPLNPVYFSMNAFLTTFHISIPGLRDRVNEDNFNIFLYSQEDGNRIGMIVEISQPNGFLGTIREWEPDARDSLRTFLSFLGKSTTPTTGFFASTNHRNETVWCQKYEEKEDFGICYAVTRSNFFIFSTSLKSVQAAIDRI
ncbi:MAG: hypothetical protein KY054_02950 [Candidatus Nealsonbacteria bacterium]|nr:hypothetical protein [Candidatus Nealsonbacteria bacterium]